MDQGPTVSRLEDLGGATINSLQDKFPQIDKNTIYQFLCKNHMQIAPTVAALEQYHPPPALLQPKLNFHLSFDAPGTQNVLAIERLVVEFPFFSRQQILEAFCCLGMNVEQTKDWLNSKCPKIFNNNDVAMIDLHSDRQEEQSGAYSRYERKRKLHGDKRRGAKKRRKDYTKLDLENEIKECIGGMESGEYKTVADYLKKRPSAVIHDSVIYKHVAKRQADPTYKVADLGRPRELTDEEELEVITNLKAIGKEFHTLNNDIILREAIEVARKQRSNEDMEKTIKRLNHMGGDDWLRSFKKRHGISYKSISRPMEIERAIKNQPEITLDHWRNLMHAHAIIQIHEALASGFNVEEWEIGSDNLATRKNGGGNEPGEDVLEVRVEEDMEWIYVIPLNKRLVYIDPSRNINVDEKPLLPDAPVKSTHYSQEIVTGVVAFGRTSSWTFTCAVRANGRADLPCLLIMRGLSSEGDVIKLANHANILLTNTEKGSTDDQTFASYLSELLPKVGATHQKPGLLQVDGHGSRFTEQVLILVVTKIDFFFKVRRILAANHFYGVVEPSHTSTTNQALDAGPNALIQREYECAYSTSVNINKGRMTNLRRVECLVRAAKVFRAESHSKAWEAIGQPMGKLDPQFLQPKDFRHGTRFRDEQCPVTEAFLKSLFSKQNLIKPNGSPFKVEVNHFKKVPRELVAELIIKTDSNNKVPRLKYILSRKGQNHENLQRMLFSRFKNKRLEIFSTENTWVEAEDLAEPTEEPIQKKTSSVRVKSGGGRFLSGDSVLAELAVSEEKQRVQAEKEKEKKEKKDEKQQHEQPIIDLFRALGFQKKDSPPTVDKMKSFIEVSRRTLKFKSSNIRIRSTGCTK